MDPWETLRRAGADRRSGAVAITRRVARAMAGLTTTREVLRAARIVLRAQPAMGSLWRLMADAYQARSPGAAATSFAEELDAAGDAAADQVRWVTRARELIVVTTSASGTVERALHILAPRLARVRCATSLPGGEGRALVRRLRRQGIAAESFDDAASARACLGAHLVLVGADAVRDDGVVNKVGTLPLALAAAHEGAACYALAPTQKFLPAGVGTADGMFERVPLELFDAILTERGPRRAAAVRRFTAAVEIPAALARLVR